MRQECNNAPRVLIAGAGGGVGRACAEAFARRGAKIVLTDCDGIALSEVAARLGAMSSHCDAIGSCSVEILAEELRIQLPAIDILINAAGRGYVRTLAMARITQAMLPLLRKGDGRRLVFNVAAPGRFAQPDGIFPYASSLDGFQRLSAVIKEQTRGSGIEVITMMPELLPEGCPIPMQANRTDPLRTVDTRRTVERIVELTLAARPQWIAKGENAARD